MEPALTYAAAINAALLAAALAAQSWRKKSATGLFASLFLADLSAAVILIAADHASAVGNSVALAFAEAFLTFAAGPLFLCFAASILRKTVDRRALALALSMIAAAALIALRHLSPGVVAERLAFAQMAFTLFVAAMAFGPSSAKSGARRGRNFVIGAVAGLAALHAAQLARSFWPEAEDLRNIVPVVGSLALIALSAAVYFGGRLGFLDALIEAPPVATPAMREIVERTEALLAAGLLKDANLTLAGAAKAAGVSADALSEAFRAVTGGGFPARLQQLRVEEALRLLADPLEARTSMEAIGLLAGFGSRSAFYQAFGERVGMTPAAYRKSLAAKPVQKTGSGQGS